MNIYIDSDGKYYIYRDNCYFRISEKEIEKYIEKDLEIFLYTI
ncbi:hypothetical protein PQE75_gp018 [Bacillus phage vB_BcoS-136]|uniref:Uncharacterized protein n=1 Tax=Bacillus phage vB_BcoS-136 TaxID=2419619 RepID=A0A3G3BVJ2_9CAUD|nr:hypothetical protein PQE75_gp018 [Bacillus phage vB_BcoS-136]AYP68150.1 hypothetical protein vBBcoS136_00018 [Bacillus phage vB_BcoS-136]